MRIILFWAILFTLLSSCAVNNQEEDAALIKQTHNYRALWFKTHERFTHLDKNRDTVFHPFFDLLPAVDFRDKQINYILVDPKGTKNIYDFDLLSGKRFLVHPVCPQEDVWKGYEGEIYRPNYKRGIIPRTLDQIGKPQEIIVFGKEPKKKKLELSLIAKQKVLIEKETNPFLRARVIGGVIEQYCDKYPCNKRRKWLSRMILIGVEPEDKQLREVFSLKELKEKIYWRGVKAHIENLKGKNVTDSQKDLPAYRIIGEISASKALSYALKKGHIFNGIELMSLRSTCHALYDYIWDMNKIIRIRKDRKNKAQIEKAKEKVSKFNIGASESVYTYFNEFFKFFSKNYHSKYLTCSKYVRATNINFDYDRHWFFSYLQSFVLLKELDYVYHCKSQAWIKNPFNAARGKNDYDFFDLLGECNQRQLDKAFEQAVVKLTTMGHHKEDTYRYITYDHGIGGTHEKMYSWVPFSGKRLNCKIKRDDNKLSTFPSDIEWKRYKGKAKRDRTILLIEDKKVSSPQTTPSSL